MNVGERAVGSEPVERLERRLSRGALERDELALCVGIGFVAAPFAGLPAAIGAAVVGAFLGSVVWHLAVKPRFLKCSRRDGLPRIHAALDGLVTTSVSA
jgi:hypothetical protein